jgi:tRNA dimethylallyltransferase
MINFQLQCKDFGYKEVVEYLDNKITKEEMIEKIKQESRRYAKRQITWFKAIKELIWLDAEDGIEKNIEIILEEIN